MVEKLATKVLLSNAFQNIFQKELDLKFLKEIGEKRDSIQITFKNKGQKISYNDIYSLSFSEISDILKMPPNNVKFWSSNYYAIDIDDFYELVKKYTGDDEKYIANQYKCSHFAIDFIDYCVDSTKHQRLGNNIAVGILAYYFTENNVRKGHAVNFAVVLEKNKLKLLIIEPQSGEIFNAKSYFDCEISKDKSDFELELLFLS